MRVAPPVVLTEDQKRTLHQWARGRSLPARQVERARVVLLAAAGKQDLEIAAEVGISNQKAARWRKRFLCLGLAGLEQDAPRPGRTPGISGARVKRVIQKTTPEKPAHGTHSSTRSMAAAVGLSESTVRRTRTSPKSWRPSSACTSIHPSMHWCCVARRRVRDKLSTARSRAGR